MSYFLISKELSNKEQDASRAKNSGERLESQLQTEVKIRTDLENRNTALDQEITKVSFICVLKHAKCT